MDGRADPAGRTSASSSMSTEARSRRGAELEANDRDPRGRPLIRPLGLTLSSFRAAPTEGLKGWAMASQGRDSALQRLEAALVEQDRLALTPPSAHRLSSEPTSVSGPRANKS